MAEASKRSGFSVLNKERLEDLGRNLEIPVPGNATKDAQVAAVADSPIDLPSILGRLRRDELRSTCRAHGLDATGRGRGDLVARLAGPGLASGDRLDKDGDRAVLAAYCWSDIPVVCSHLRAVETDFEARLGQRASTEWMLERYARRCRRLRRNELTDMLEALRASDKRELALTRDAAVFLFDQGCEVLTEQSMGSHRYDIIGEPLLVEAKIYDGKRLGLAAVVDGLSQIHQYANALADEGVHAAPVLLVFRLGGARATPVPEYKIGNLRVTIQHVDLGSSADSGRKSPPPEPDITEATITAALARKTAAPAGKTKKRRRAG